MIRPRYGLQRAGQWIAPASPTGPITTPFARNAWTTSSLDQAHDRRDLLRHCYGINTTIVAVPNMPPVSLRHSSSRSRSALTMAS